MIPQIQTAFLDFFKNRKSAWRAKVFCEIGVFIAAWGAFYYNIRNVPPWIPVSLMFIGGIFQSFAAKQVVINNGKNDNYARICFWIVNSVVTCFALLAIWLECRAGVSERPLVEIGASPITLDASLTSQGAPAGAIEFTIGTAGNVFTSEKLRQRKWNVLRENCTLKLYMVGTNITIDCQIFTMQDITPYIVSNKFRFLPAGFQTNGNANAFEVVDRTLNPIFQFIKTGATAYSLFGLFVCTNNSHSSEICIADQDSVTVVSWPTNRADAPKLKARRIFKYPTWQYGGKLMEYSN